MREREPWELENGCKAEFLDMVDVMLEAEYPWSDTHYSDEGLIVMCWQLWTDEGLYPYQLARLQDVLEKRGLILRGRCEGYSRNFEKEGMLSYVWHDDYKDIYHGWHIGWFNPHVIYPITSYTDVNQMGDKFLVHTLEQAKNDTTEKVWREAGGAWAVRQALISAGFRVGNF